MKRIFLLSPALAAILSTTVFAGSFYIGPALFVQNISATMSSYRDIHTRISIGYGQMVDDYYLGGEFFFVPGTTVLSNSVSPGDTSAKVSNSYGISFIPGLILNDKLMGYLRLGALTTNFTGAGTYKAGLQAGVGFETGLAKNWNLRGEYIYSSYKRITGLGSSNSNELGMGVIYQFG